MDIPKSPYAVKWMVNSLNTPTEIMQFLGLCQIVPLKPLDPVYPRSYDPNARCDYHGGVVGHATERCWSLKHKIQDLLDEGQVEFQD
ncbi:hypothetical protein CR513_55392, partial [Mucuna pruriens]